jgi:hypothetical protein
MSELKRMDLDFLVREIKRAADEAYRQIDTKVVDLIQQVRQAVAVLPLDLEAPVQALYVKDFTVPSRDPNAYVELYEGNLRFNGAVVDEQRSDVYCASDNLRLVEDNRLRLKTGHYRAMLTITKIEP